jgi:hypothetical protein
MNATYLKLVRGGDLSGDVVCLQPYLALDQNQRLSLLADWLYVLEELRAVEEYGAAVASERPGYRQARMAIKYWRPSRALRLNEAQGKPCAAQAVTIDVSRYDALTQRSKIEAALVDYPEASFTDIAAAFGVTRCVVAGLADRAGLTVLSRVGGGRDD